MRWKFMQDMESHTSNLINKLLSSHEIDSLIMSGESCTGIDLSLDKTWRDTQGRQQILLEPYLTHA